MRIPTMKLRTPPPDNIRITSTTNLHNPTRISRKIRTRLNDRMSFLGINQHHHHHHRY